MISPGLSFLVHKAGIIYFALPGLSGGSGADVLEPH